MKNKDLGCLTENGIDVIGWLQQASNEFNNDCIELGIKVENITLDVDNSTFINLVKYLSLKESVFNNQVYRNQNINIIKLYLGNNGCLNIRVDIDKQKNIIKQKIEQLKFELEKLENDQT